MTQVEPILSIFLSHDSSICVRDDAGNFRVFELERLLKERFARVNHRQDLKAILEQMKVIINKECNVNSFRTCHYLGLDQNEKRLITEIWGCTKFVESFHHISHAACSYYQSPFNETLVISYDGGGYDGGSGEDRIGYFNIYHVKGTEFKKLKYITYDLGTAYGLSALPISEVNKTEENWPEKFLSFAGKLMGLVGYGNVRNEWIEPFKIFYKEHKHVNAGDLKKSLSTALNLSLNINSLSGQDSYDFAATSQKAFEEIILDEILPYIEQYKLPVCLSGGCALNVIMNEKLRNILGHENIFVPPNPNDCGLTFGMTAYHYKPENKINLMYSGFPILDISELSTYIEKYKGKPITIPEFAQLLSEGKIIGLMRGNSEHGPRALGNRSILCDPSFRNMKDTLNHKVKFREWYRPFAPMVKIEEVNKYFEFMGDASYMSYSPKIKTEYLDIMPSIVHEDKTARVQTVSKDNNDYIYSLLTEFEKIKNFGCILNTSFNIKGRPILTSISDAIEVLNTTEIDAIIIEGYLFEKFNKL